MVDFIANQIIQTSDWTNAFASYAVCFAIQVPALALCAKVPHYFVIYEATTMDVFNNSNCDRSRPPPPPSTKRKLEQCRQFEGAIES